jgi:clan AA aspartic protease
MGLIRGSFSLSNPTRPDLAPLEVSALADSGAVHLCIPEHLAIQLSLAELERREVVLADGHRRTVPYVGPVEVRFRNRRCFTGAMVLGNEVLLGAIPMEDMDLVLRRQLQSVDVNPESPNIPLSVAKCGARGWIAVAGGGGGGGGGGEEGWVCARGRLRGGSRGRRL